ncbi:MAG: Na+/H+ antiporter subunit E [Gammaproteobacteria bacterium]|jgi:multisubunit Na+/H+ antiporter MnhE subunit
MNRLSALLLLLWHFASAMLLSAWATSRIILTCSEAPRRGFVRFAYEDLNETGVVLLAAMVTLTPGTSTVDIDPQRRELLLHVLDSDDIEVTLSAIRRDFLLPLQRLFGERS